MRRLLKDEADIEIIGASVNGREAVEAIHQLKPDLVFLDVQMPELDGFGVVSQLDPSQMPVIIFITANHEFALKAFEVQALDYLIKPCGRDRFQLALKRARVQIQRRQVDRLIASEVKTAPRLPGRLAVKSEGRILFVRLEDIEWVEAANHHVVLHVGNETHTLNTTVSALEERLPADRFLRVSETAIANIEQIKELHSIARTEYVVLQNGVRLILTRGYRNRLHQLGL
jgi:two-component system LytT family response regulator